MQPAAIMEVEAFNYWMHVRALNAVSRLKTDEPDVVRRIREELETMALHTEWPRLRARCHDVLNSADAVAALGGL